jgi:hypothetical protein
MMTTVQPPAPKPFLQAIRSFSFPNREQGRKAIMADFYRASLHVAAGAGLFKAGQQQDAHLISPTDVYPILRGLKFFDSEIYGPRNFPALDNPPPLPLFQTFQTFFDHHQNDMTFLAAQNTPLVLTGIASAIVGALFLGRGRERLKRLLKTA